MNSVPPCGRYFFSAKSKMPMRIDGEEHAGDAAQPADRDHDQEVDEIDQRILRAQPEELGAKSAADRRHAAAEGEARA